MKVSYASDGNPGKLAEYSEVNDSNRAKAELHNRAWSRKVNAEVRLVTVGAGYEPAGSVARWTEGYHAVRWNDPTGSIQGRRYKLDDFDSASRHFDSLTWSARGRYAWEK